MHKVLQSVSARMIPVADMLANVASYGIKSDFGQ